MPLYNPGEISLFETMRRGKANILLVADRNEQMNLLSEALVSIGHTATIVNTVAEALTCADRRTFDLVIADIDLSDSDRVDFHRTMKRCHADLPVILITSPSGSALIRTDETESIVSKPFRISHIEELINVILEDKSDTDVITPGESVLVVDDDDAFRTMLIRSLQVSGYDAVGATDGQMAIELIERGGIGSVITDINMPYMDGVTLMKKIKLRWPRIPVILITGYYSNDENPAGSNIRPDGFLMKPFKVQSIDRLLRSLYDKSSSD